MNDKKKPSLLRHERQKKKQKKNSLLRHERQIKAKKKSTQAQEPISVVTNQLKDKYSEIC